MTILVEAGQVWRAATARGRRFVRVERVAKRDQPPRVHVVECTAIGGNIRKSRDGFPPDLSFTITLNPDTRGRWTMPRPYEMEV